MKNESNRESKEIERVPAEVVTDELTSEEESERLFLERKVERAFYEAGKALKQLRDKRLYRSTHRTFEEYIKYRFGMKQSRSYQLIDAVKVVDNLSQKVSPLMEDADNSTQKVPPLVEVLPTSERQCRPLTTLEPELQREAWGNAVESAGGRLPSSRLVKDVVQRIKERTQKARPNPYHIGEVCQIIAKNDPELKDKAAQWCIISEVHEFSCTVRTYQGEFTLRLENLRLVDYSNADCRAMGKLCDRISSIYSDDMEEVARCNLAYFAKLDRPSLTALEENLLAVLEAH